MQLKLPEGYVMLMGTAGKDADFRRVGSRNVRRCEVSLAIGKRDGQTVWATVQAWHDLASVLGETVKGCSVLAIGKPKDDSYTARDGHKVERRILLAEWVSAAVPGAVQTEAPSNEGGGFGW